jgi:hypothetical protein
MGERDINDIHRVEGLDAARAHHDSAKPFNTGEAQEREKPEGAGSGAPPDESDIPADTRKVIREGAGEGAQVLWNCTLVLHRLDFTIDDAVALFEKYPNGVAKKYRGRLRAEVEGVYARLNAPPSPDGRGPPNRQADVPGRSPRPEPPALGEWDAGDDLNPPSPRGWLLGTVFCRTFISSLIAEGGSGKTALRYAQYLSLAIGKSLTGEHVFQRCRALIVSLEDDAEELKRRVLAACIRHSVTLDEVTGWLFLAAPGARAGKIMTLDRRGRPELGTLCAALETAIIRRKIDLVALDPFIKAHGVTENDNNLIDQVAQILADLGAKHSIAVDIPHHVRKGAAEPGNADRGRGASAARDAARLVYTLTTMTPDEASAFSVPEDQRRSYIRMDSAKVNIAPPMTKARWFKLVGVPLGNATELYPNGDEVQTVEPWSPPQTWDGLDIGTLNRILDAIEAGLADGSRYSNDNAAKTRAAWKAVKIHAPQKTEAQCKEIIRQWVKNGLLVVELYHGADRKDHNGLRVNNTKRPGARTDR